MSPAELSRVFNAAFKEAEKSRVAAGMDPRKRVPIAMHKDGRRFVGPRRYRVTVWLEPQEYLDLLESRRHARFKGSLRDFMISMAATTSRKAKARPRLRAVG